MAIMAVIITLGYWAPWTGDWGLGRRIPLWAWLAFTLSRLGLVSVAVATPLVIVIAALIAAKGAVLRVWGVAYLGSATVLHHQMKAGPLIAGGPYRYVRNPLYIGLWATTAAMAFLMPPTGALFVLIAVLLFLLRIVLGEEAFLSGQLGQPYLDYLRAVPRLIPRLRTTLPPNASKPRWLHAVLSEINPIGVFIILAFLSWNYDNQLMVRAIIVCFGLSLIVRALLSGARQQAAPAIAKPE